MVIAPDYPKTALKLLINSKNMWNFQEWIREILFKIRIRLKFWESQNWKTFNTRMLLKMQKNLGGCFSLAINKYFSSWSLRIQKSLACYSIHKFDSINSLKLKQIKVQSNSTAAWNKSELVSEIGIEIESNWFEFVSRRQKGSFTIALSVCVIVKVFGTKSALNLLHQRMIRYFRHRLMWCVGARKD